MREQSAIVTAAAGPRLLPDTPWPADPVQSKSSSTPPHNIPQRLKRSPSKLMKSLVCVYCNCSVCGRSDTLLQKEADRIRRRKIREVKGAHRHTTLSFVCLADRAVVPVMLVSPGPFSGFSTVAHTPISARSSRERKVNAPKTISTALRCQDPRTRTTYVATHCPAQYHSSPPDNP
jgi:hypothetical protein